MKACTDALLFGIRMVIVYNRNIGAKYAVVSHRNTVLAADVSVYVKIYPAAQYKATLFPYKNISAAAEAAVIAQHGMGPLFHKKARAG